MKVLIACEESQTVTNEFRAFGHEAYSCDILPCSGDHPEWHLQQDVVSLLKEEWDMIIAFPPCTYMSNAGACRMYHPKGVLDEKRFEKAMEAKEFFMLFYNSDCEKIAIENPVPLKIVGLPEYSQIIQPYFFGDPYTKKTLLWLKGLPLLKPTNIVNPIAPYIPSGTSRKLGGKYLGAAKRGNDKVNRSKTFGGIAKAMATQWGK